MRDITMTDQAVGAVMMALQKSLMEQSDIVPVLKGFKFAATQEGLTVINPPLVKFNEETTEIFREAQRNELSEVSTSERASDPGGFDVVTTQPTTSD